MKKMNRRLLIAVSVAAAIVALSAALNIEVTTRQGIDYTLITRKMPLYLKALDFLDRHYNYELLAKRVIGKDRSEESRALKLLLWVKSNIRENPGTLPVVDDHVWHIIVRGYGTNDQFQDVFSTLCNYAGIESFFGRIISKDRKSGKLLAFTRFKGGWSVFDAYDGVYFRNGRGQIACGADLTKGDWIPVSVTGDKIEYDYRPLFDNISSVRFGVWEASRSAIQSPLRRLMTWLKGDKRRPEEENR